MTAVASINDLRQLLDGVTPRPGFQPFQGFLPQTGKHADGHRGQRYAAKLARRRRSR